MLDKEQMYQVSRVVKGAMNDELQGEGGELISYLLGFTTFHIHDDGSYSVRLHITHTDGLQWWRCYNAPLTDEELTELHTDLAKLRTNYPN